jgi:hypothetical protein
MSIEEIKERLINASGNGWYLLHGTDICYEWPPGSCDEHIICNVSSVDDAELIANAPTDIAYLINENQRLVEALEKIAEEITIDSNDSAVLMGKAAIALNNHRLIADQALQAYKLLEKKD